VAALVEDRKARELPVDAQEEGVTPGLRPAEREQGALVEEGVFTDISAHELAEVVGVELHETTERRLVGGHSRNEFDLHRRGARQRSAAGVKVTMNGCV
jgi:hypothetical protein